MTNGTELSLSQSLQRSSAQDHEPLAQEAAPLKDQDVRWYVAVLLLLPLIAVPLCILLGKSDYFLHHGASVWVRSNDAVFNLQGRNCRVLIFGDSTAMTGINPDVVQQRTGLPTCNISVTNAVLSVTDRLTLDHYLAYNARPDVILVQLSPEGFQDTRRSWDRTIYAEGLLELLRHTPPDQSRRVLLGHPQQALTFAGYAAGFSAWYALKRAVLHTTHIALDEEVQVHNGFFTPPMPPQTHCEESDDRTVLMQTSSLRQVVSEYRQYAQQHGKVLVNVAPIPSCDRKLSVYQAEFSGVTSNALLALPIQFFNDQRHFTAIGSQFVSRMVSDQVNTLTGHGAVEGIACIAALHKRPVMKRGQGTALRIDRQ